MATNDFIRVRLSLHDSINTILSQEKHADNRKQNK